MDQASVVAGVGAVAAFGVAGGALALYGVGVPFAAGAAGLALCAGALLRAIQRPPGPSVAEAGLRDRLQQLEAAASTLRHDLRGVLSPALMVSDRLTTHSDPAIKRAGEAVVKSVERATALLTATKLPAPEKPS